MSHPLHRPVSQPYAGRARRELSRKTLPAFVSHHRSSFLLLSLFFMLCLAAVPVTAARPGGQHVSRDVGHADGSGALHASLATTTGVGLNNNSNHVENSPSTKPASRQLALMPGIAQLYALDPADGSIVWQFGDLENSNFMAAPAWVDGRIFVNDYFSVRALDPATGIPIWNYTFQSPNRIDSVAPSVGAGVVVISTEGDQLVALDAANGTKRWSHPSMNVRGAAVITTAGVVLVATHQKQLMAFDAANGTHLWSKAFPYYTLTNMNISPDESTLYFVMGCIYLTAVDLATQEVKWTTLIFRKDMLCDGSTMSFDTALAPDGTIYAGYREVIHHIAANGTVLWKISLDPNLDYVSGPTLSSGNLLDSVVTFTEAYFFGLDAHNGTMNWNVSTASHDWLTHEPMPLANHTAAYMVAGTALAVDTLTGAVKWNTTLDTAFYTSGIGCECPPPYSLPRCRNLCGQ